MVDETEINRKTQTVCLMILTAFAVALGLYLLKPAVVPFVWAFFLSVILGPAVKFQIRYLWFPRELALVVTLGLVLVTIAVVGGFIASSIADFAANSSQYEQTVERLIRQAESAGLLKTFGITLPEELNFAALIPTGSLRDIILRMTNAIMFALSRGLLVILFAAFLLAGYTLRKDPSQGFIGEMEASVKQYVTTKVLISGVTGLLVFGVLALLGIPYAISFGAFAFVLNFIPTVGSVLATILPLPIILIMPGISTASTILAVALPSIIQIAIGSVLEPKIMGKSLDLHPITVLLALIFWGMVWGFEGLILGVPITAIIRIILEKIEMTSLVSHLMAGRLKKGLSED